MPAVLFLKILERCFTREVYGVSRFVSSFFILMEPETREKKS